MCIKNIIINKVVKIIKVDFINHTFQIISANVKGNTHETKKHNTLMEAIVICNLKHFVYDD